VLIDPVNIRIREEEGRWSQCQGLPGPGVIRVQGVVGQEIAGSEVTRISVLECQGIAGSRDSRIRR
jgi:hypothetical protein